jgi:hypothetical protein
MNGEVTSVKCPKCKLINPPDAYQCDCGYNFRFETEFRPIPGASARREITETDLIVGAAFFDNLIAVAGGLMIAVFLGQIHIAFAVIGLAFMIFYKIISRLKREQGLGWWLAKRVAVLDRRFRLGIKD